MGPKACAKITKQSFFYRFSTKNLNVALSLQVLLINNNEISHIEPSKELFLPLYGRINNGEGKHYSR